MQHNRLMADSHRQTRLHSTVGLRRVGRCELAIRNMHSQGKQDNRRDQTPTTAPSTGQSLTKYTDALLASNFHFPGQLSGNMTPSEKPEVHNVLHCRWRRTEPQPRPQTMSGTCQTRSSSCQATCQENLVNIKRLVSEIGWRAELQTDALIIILSTL